MAGTALGFSTRLISLNSHEKPVFYGHPYFMDEGREQGEVQAPVRLTLTTNGGARIRSQVRAAQGDH